MNDLASAEHDRSGALGRPRAPPLRAGGSEDRGTSRRPTSPCGLLPCALLLGLMLTSACSGTPDPDATNCEAIDRDLTPLLEAKWSHVIGATDGRTAWNAAQRWIERMLVPHDQWISLGWCDLRAERVDEAGKAFAIAIGRVRHSADASVGLGYVALRQDRDSEATQRFAAALDREHALDDARDGLRISLRRIPAGDPAAVAARDTLKELAARTPADDELQYLLAVADRKSGGPGEFRRQVQAPHTVDGMAYMRYAEYDESGVLMDLSQVMPRSVGCKKMSRAPL